MRNEMKLQRLIVTAIAVMALPLAAHAQDEQGVQIRGLNRIDTTVRLDRGGAVDLSLISGKIRVTGWDRADVKISASIESGYLRFNANSSRVSLSVEDSDNDGRRGRRHNDVGDARYDVSVPRGSRLILEAVSGDVISKGSQGEIEATSVSGDVDVTDGVRTVSAESVSGNVHAASVNGNLRTETVSGDLRAENVTGDVEASTVSGSIRLVGIQSKDVRTESVSGDIVYTGSIEPSGRYSFGGDLSTDFPVTIPPNPNGRRREGHMDFTIGDGRAKVTAQTFSGSIIINSGSDSTTRRDDE
jgi:DUF4097 and DUF4098 domain-containing protein YvlB